MPLAAPRVFIDAYPYEGGKFTITNDQAAFINVSTSKSIRNGGDGAFTLDLAPGGPYGVNSRPTWADIFTPFSLVVIGMRRAPYQQVVMVGLVGSTEEGMQRTPNGVGRVVRIAGYDFTRMFTAFCYYNLNFQIGVDQGALGSLGLLSTLGDALTGPPERLGSAWYNQVMAGPGSLMADTSFAYRGQRPSFFSLMATLFEAFPAPIQIPSMAPFLGDEGTWRDKFLTFFPYPWYEFFVQTAPVGYYPGSTAAIAPIVMDGFPAVSPTLVARVNPLPFLITGGDPAAPSFDVNMTLWSSLQRFVPTPNVGPIAFSLGYTDEEVRNYYVFMPTWLAKQFGAANGSVSPFQLLFSAWMDIGSIHRYGFRPLVSEVRWMADPTGSYAKALAAAGKGLPDMQQLVSILALRPVAYHEPTPNMLRGTVTWELRPDIMPGTLFSFAPYRDGVIWTFYVDAVGHDVPFGGRTTTTLQVSRGLPATAYADPKLMTALMTGNAIRMDGKLQIGQVPGIGAPLQPLNTQTLAAALGATSKLFAIPRGPP